MNNIRTINSNINNQKITYLMPKKNNKLRKNSSWFFSESYAIKKTYSCYQSLMELQKILANMEYYRNIIVFF